MLRRLAGVFHVRGFFPIIGLVVNPRVGGLKKVVVFPLWMMSARVFEHVFLCGKSVG